MVFGRVNRRITAIEPVEPVEAPEATAVWDDSWRGETKRWVQMEKMGDWRK
jgi:hypothetical protein